MISFSALITESSAQSFRLISFVIYIYIIMEVLGQTMNQSGKVIGNQLTGHDMYLGSKMSSQQHKSRAHLSQNERVHRSDLERGHQIP